MREEDTIAALATAPGEAGIAVVRISGPRSLAIADAVFHGGRCRPSALPARQFMHGQVRSGSEGTPDIDEAILLVYRAPQSYTREDVVEIQGHGGVAGARRMLRVVLEAGARPAEPGEFTRRAFLNGRIDLLQAEAVADLIRARSDRAAAAAVEQLDGSLSRECDGIYDALLGLAADVEATLDFAEEDLPATVRSDLVARLDQVRLRLVALLATWEEGHLLREGALVVISGLPNAGKSTLMNRLLGRERAIVTPLPGTTRDSLEETLILDGIPLRLVDTAGLRATDCVIEREGVRRAEQWIEQANIHVHLVDVSCPMTDEAMSMIQRLPPESTIIVYNKIDLCPHGVDHRLTPGYTPVYCSLLGDADLTELKKALARRLGVAVVPSHAVISERHRQIIQSVQDILNACAARLGQPGGEAEVLAAQDLRMALESLGTLTGRVYSDDLLDNIFSRFCVGK